ncbi:MAG: amino acid ABC transporter permease [Gammaproteobacteria bacterium]|nr:amino acid ABC transporter permease [Gammaproteobacteria bacterium]MBT3725366.1 amino acid ABC transporter permease [Gammaproteobacteria bacterium]MBT4194829.1 amino acid ABC transporter permease [Gammaproteobacteria bacterium]MBT4451002.1 amino acid ABC transporter permease [Gammaproteobacteria bacterium]MBT4861731.1 amino acid ABC transporter permease [Gammaproteobacteria bacterium]
MKAVIPGVTTKATTDLPVLHSHKTLYGAPSGLEFSHWLANISPWTLFLMLAAVALWPITVLAQDGGVTTLDAFKALWRWLPFLIGNGFVMTIVISFLTMLIGTVLGVFLGLGQISPNSFIARFSWFITQVFRNSPWLVLLFIVMLSFPFEIQIGDTIIPVPDWMKAVIGLALPIMANISEIVRGAINSVPTAQWEASESLAFSRHQTLFKVILPQCFKRMIPPWMNWYAILTMATPIVSILGVEEVLNLTRQAIEAEDNHPELLVPFYGFVLAIFFLYSYPIARFTVRLEKRFALKQ